MTISNTVRTAGPFIGDGIITDFPFSFKVFSRDDVLVAVTDTSGQETFLTMDSDYNIALNPDQNNTPGGVISKKTALPSGYTLAATSNLPILQALDLTNNGGFYPKVINDALDRMAINLQQLAVRFGLGPINVGQAAQIAAILAFTQDLKGDGGADLVGYLAPTQGAVRTTAGKKFAEEKSLGDWGAVGDNIEVAKNNAAWKKAEAYVNSFPSNTFAPVSILIPDGIFKYTYTPNFKRPVRLYSTGGAVLNYTGTGEVLVMGNKAQTSAEPGTNDYYEIDNISFIGAGSASYGIYFANWVLQSKVTNCRFLNFGSPNMYALTYQGNNWSIDLNNNRYLTTDGAGIPRHWCRVFGVSKTTNTAGTVSAGQVVNGEYDGSNSRLNALNNWVRFGGDTPGIGYVITGTKSRIVGGGVENPSVAVFFDATGITIFDAEVSIYCETPYGFAVFQVAGSVAGLDIHDCYINLHNTSFYNSTAKFFVTNGSTARVSSADIRDMTILNAGKYPLVTLRDAPGNGGNNFSGKILTDAPLLCTMANNYYMGYRGYQAGYHNNDLLGALDTSLTTITTAQQRISSRLRVSSGSNLSASVSTSSVAGTNVPPCRNKHFALTWNAVLAAGNYIALEARMDDLAAFAGDIVTAGFVARYVNNSGATSIAAVLQIATYVNGVSTVIASKNITLTSDLQGFTLAQVVSAVKGLEADFIAANMVIQGAGHSGVSAIEVLNVDMTRGEFPPPVMSVDRPRQVNTSSQWFRRYNNGLNQASAVTAFPVQLGAGWATPTRNAKLISVSGATSVTIVPFGENSVYLQPSPATGQFDTVFTVEAE